MCGTIHYLAPETFKGRQPFDTKCEAWSLGVMLHELLLGERPFKADTRNKIAKLILEQQIVFHDSKWDGLSIETVDLLECLLCKDPKQRLAVLDILKHSCLEDVDLD